MLGIAVKPVRHGAASYPVGAVLGAPEFTDAHLDTLFRVEFARPVSTPDARLLLIAKHPLTTEYGNVAAGDEIPDGILTDEVRELLLSAGAVAWIPDCEIAEASGQRVLRAMREIKHGGVTYSSGTVLPGDAVTADEADLLVRIGLAERVPVSAVPKTTKANDDNRRRRKN